MILSDVINTFISLVLLSNCIQIVLNNRLMLPAVFEWFSLIIASIPSFNKYSLSPCPGGGYILVGKIRDKHNKLVNYTVY